MKKFLLCAIHAKYIHSSPAVWYLKKAVEDLPVETSVTEWTINGTTEGLLSAIKQKNPDYIGFSCYIWNISYICKLAQIVKDMLPHTVLIFGGPEISFRAKEFLYQYDCADYCIIGEGEEPVQKLISSLLFKQDPRGIPGVAGRGTDGSVWLELPEYRKDWPPFPMEEYCCSLGNRIAYLESSRGCPFSCAFCLSGIHEPVRFHDMEETKRDICALANSGAKIIKFVDRTFNCNKDRAYQILSYLLERRGKDFPEYLRFHFEIGADLFDEKTLTLLEKAPKGFFQMEAGLQSFHKETLQEVQRKTDMVLLEKNLRRLISMDTVHIHIDLIAGLPFETYDSFADSFNRAFSFRPHMLQLGFLKMLHGSKLRRDSEKYGYEFDGEPPYEFRKNYWMNEEDAGQIHLAEDALERMYNSHRFLETVEYVLKAAKLSPFELFLYVGENTKAEDCKMSLDRYTELVYEALQKLDGVSRKELRDVMACDRLASNSTGRLPMCLRVFDSSLKGLSQKYRKKTGHNVGTTLLYSKTPLQIFCADYGEKDPIWDRYRSFTEEFMQTEG